MYEKAKNPDRVVDKIYECRFFLAQMADYEGKLDNEKFLFCLSAFMSAFRTAANRLYGVTEHKFGKVASRALRSQLHRHPEIGFLIGRTNVEVHADGAVVYQRYSVEVPDPARSRWEPRSVRNTDRWRSFSKSRFGEPVVIRRAAGWRFAENSKNLIELCHDGLQAMQGFIVPVLVTAPPEGGMLEPHRDGTRGVNAGS
jgi:hypothetical protein